MHPQDVARDLRTTVEAMFFSDGGYGGLLQALECIDDTEPYIREMAAGKIRSARMRAMSLTYASPLEEVVHFSSQSTTNLLGKSIDTVVDQQQYPSEKEVCLSWSASHTCISPM